MKYFLILSTLVFFCSCNTIVDSDKNLDYRKSSKKVQSGSIVASDGKCCNNYPAPVECVGAAWTLSTDMGEKNITDCDCQAVYRYYGLPYGNQSIILGTRVIPGDLLEYLKTEVITNNSIVYSVNKATPKITYTPRQYPAKLYRIKRVLNGVTTDLGTTTSNTFTDTGVNLKTVTGPVTYQVIYVNWGGQDRLFLSDPFNPIGVITVSAINGPTEVYSPRRGEPNYNVQYNVSISGGCGIKQVKWYTNSVSAYTNFANGQSVTYSASYVGNDVSFNVTLIAIITDECGTEIRREKVIHLSNILEP